MYRSRYLFLIVGVALAYFSSSVSAGGVLLPLDVLHHLGPFSDSVPKALETVRNFHLTDLVTMMLNTTHPEELVPLLEPRAAL